MEVGDDKVGTCELPIERRGGQHDPSQPRDQELEQKPDAEEHGRLELELSSPHRREPVEYLDSCRHRNRHSCEHEKGVRICIHSDGEHVVTPHAQAEKPNRDGAPNHQWIPKQHLAEKEGNDFENNRKSWKYKQIISGMAEDQKKVHPGEGRAARHDVKK